MKRVLFDSDVILDVFLQREPYFRTSALAIDRVGQDQVEGYVAGHAVTNLFYLLRRQLGSDRAREILRTLMSKMQVASVTDGVIREALESSFSDFEDAVTHAAAQAMSVEIIVTRNVRDFRLGTIPAVLPEVFLVDIDQL